MCTAFYRPIHDVENSRNTGMVKNPLEPRMLTTRIENENSNKNEHNYCVETEYKQKYKIFSERKCHYRITMGNREDSAKR